MQLVLASGNKGKLREFRAMFDEPIVPFGEVMEPFEIVEDGDTFAANALIKARAIYRGLTRSDKRVQGSGFRLQEDDGTRHSGLDPESHRRSEGILNQVQDDKYIVISDDSGISVPALGGEPGIYSARYAGEDAGDRDNLCKLIDTLKSRGIKRTPAYYTAAIAIVSARGEYVVHGWMHGEVIAEARGDRGFGYDPMFIPYRGLTSDDMSAHRLDGADESSAGLTPSTLTLGELEDEVKKSISHRSKALMLARPIIGMLMTR